RKQFDTLAILEANNMLVAASIRLNSNKLQAWLLGNVARESDGFFGSVYARAILANIDVDKDHEFSAFGARRRRKVAEILSGVGYYLYVGCCFLQRKQAFDFSPANHRCGNQDIRDAALYQDFRFAQFRGTQPVGSVFQLFLADYGGFVSLAMWPAPAISC